MQRVLILLFGVFSYLVFFLTFLYLIAFVGNLQLTGLVQWAPWLPGLVPHSIDAGRATGPVGMAVVINLVLISLFGLQHSIMARMGFKDRIKRMVPEAAERSVFVLISSLVLILLFWQWRPIPEVIWSADSMIGQSIGWVVFALGFGLVLLSTFLIDHFELFGLRQSIRQFLNKPHEYPHFVTPMLYKHIRHPLYLGFILAFWGGPVMTLGHLIFAGVLTIYILIAIQLEEKDLVRFLGERYRQYREQVPMLIPWPGKRYRGV